MFRYTLFQERTQRKEIMEGNLKKLLFFGTVLIVVYQVTNQTDVTYEIHEYILITGLEMSWTEAQSYCRAEYGDLATISDAHHLSRIKDMTEELVTPFWIGLYDDTSSWRWSLVGELFYTEVGKDYRRWQEGQPDNVGAAEHCVSMNEDGFWRDDSCTLVKMALVCFTGGEEDPYVLVTEQKSWFEAQSFCRQHHTDLVSVRSPSENEAVRSRLQGSQYVQEAWIGLHRDSWKWSDGSSSSFRQWWMNQPNNTDNSEACVHMQRGRWSDWNCSARFNILCQDVTVVTVPTEPLKQAVQRQTTVRVKLLTESDLTDPTIRHQVLQQFEAALHLRGLTDVKLLWRTLTPEPQPTERDACGGKIKENLS